MVDIHSHILPGVDDGAKDWNMAETMCRMAAADGIRHIVATPHANDEYFYDRAAHQKLLDELQRRLGPAIELSLGCDFHVSFENLADLARSPQNYTINGGRYLLVEFNDYAIPPAVSQAVLRLGGSGIVPVITHPERNPVLQRKPEQIVEYAAAGCLIQLTANSVTGFWGDKARKTSDWLLERSAVHVLATDCHSLKSRPPVISAARDVIALRFGAAVAEALVNTNPRAIVENRDLPASS